MRLSQAWLVARHDLALVRQRKSILYGLVVFPFVVAVGFPLVVRYAEMHSGGIPNSFLLSLLDAFSFWFVIGAATLPTAIASYSIVGEKTEKSLEPLLATPTTDGEILLGKTLTAFLPTVLAAWAGSVVFMLLMDLETRPHLGYLYYPNPEMAVILFGLAPLAALFAIELSILISARAVDVRSAQQLTGLVFLPFILLYVLGEIGVVVLDTTNLLYICGLLGAVVLGLFFVSRQTFHREEILTRWR